MFFENMNRKYIKPFNKVREVEFSSILCMSNNGHDNGKHKGWWKNPNNPHNPNHPHDIWETTWIE